MTERDHSEPPLDVDLQRADALAAAAISEDAKTAPPDLQAPPPARRWTGTIVTLVCLVVLVTQLPALRTAFKAPPSIRVGTAQTDEDTDACVDNLWKISSVLQNHTFKANEFLEPSTQRPYHMREADGDTFVECPNPGAHGLRSLRVSKAHRAPEAKR